MVQGLGFERLRPTHLASDDAERAVHARLDDDGPAPAPLAHAPHEDEVFALPRTHRVVSLPSARAISPHAICTCGKRAFNMAAIDARAARRKRAGGCMLLGRSITLTPKALGLRHVHRDESMSKAKQMRPAGTRINLKAVSRMARARAVASPVANRGHLHAQVGRGLEQPAICWYSLPCLDLHYVTWHL